MNNFTLHRPFGPSIGELPLPESIVHELNSLVDTESSNRSVFEDIGHLLAGEIASELRLKNSTCDQLGVTDFLAQCAGALVLNSCGQKISRFKLISFWINRQMRNEYNPTHWHSGHLSGAGWLKVPDDIQSGGIKTNQHQGVLALIHGSRQFLCGSKYEVVPEVGKFVMFPNYMMHHVYPFSVDGERRSFAFNAEIDDDIYNVYGSN